MKINVYNCIDKATNVDEPYIYVKKNHLPFETIPLKHLFGVIQDIEDISLTKSGIAIELIYQADLSLEVPNIDHIADDIIAYYSPFESDTKENVLNIIKTFNQLSSKITIYTSTEIHTFVKEFSNSNISFCVYYNPQTISIEANKIITFGYSARSFIQQKIPTLVIGPFGFGGWVTPQNINYLLKDNFRGRPSGRHNEVTPVAILADELEEIREEKDIKIILEENASIVTSFEKIVAEYGSKEHFIKQQNKLLNYLTDAERKWHLIPKLATNVQLVKKQKDTIFKRREVNDFLFSLPNTELEFMEDLKNELSCKILRDKYKMKDSEFWDIMIHLWERKAIVFSNEI